MQQRSSSPRFSAHPFGHRALQALALVSLSLACSPDSSSGGSVGGGGPIPVAFDPVGGSFTYPLFLTSPPNDPRLFVVEKGGTIRIVENGQQLPVPFLDVSAKISTGGEQGLLGLAFDPAYSTNGRFYIDYTNPAGGTVIERYRVSSLDPDVADPASDSPVLTYAHTAGNHNGGMIAFGPDDMLYIASGEGGDASKGQTLDDLLGAVLRIDVSGASGYTIPPNNPFAGGGGEPEIWSYGLRNPWRVSFDRLTGDLYIADVGESASEEIDVAPAATGTGRGANYGWSIMEGTFCHDPPVGCNAVGLTLPEAEYGHANGCAIVGGFVYRGAAIPALRGTYFYSDNCDGWLKSFRFVGGAATEFRNWPTFPSGLRITSFGEDAAGEVYVLTDSGLVYRIIPG